MRQAMALSGSKHMDCEDGAGLPPVADGNGATLHPTAIDQVTAWRLSQDVNRNGSANPWLKETKRRVGKGTRPPPAPNCSKS